jgi:hypothetical protein
VLPGAPTQKTSKQSSILHPAGATSKVWGMSPGLRKPIINESALAALQPLRAPVSLAEGIVA